MSTTTTNLSLTKPDTSDLADIADINANMDALDTWFGSQAPGSITFGAAASAGSASRIARADHTHDTSGIAYGVPVAVGASNSAGVATTLSRSDHVHQGSSYLNHGPETFDINAGVTEDIRVYVPESLSSATLVLRGRALVAGLVAAHTHSVTSNVTATTNSTGGESLTSGNASADHTHSATTGTGSADHTHTTTIASGGGHTHDIVGSGFPGNPSAIQVNSTAASQMSGYIYSEGSHDHGGATASGGQSATHTHSVTTGGVSATHSHSVTTANHSHTVTVTNNAVNSGSTGSGGFTASTRPAGVTVTIDGTDRTSALGGAFGTSGSDWDEQSLNVLAYINSVGWHTILLGCTTGGRLKAQVFMQV